MKRIIKYIIWIAVIVLIIAAGLWLLQRFRGTSPPIVEVNKPAIVTCTPDCISFGQCGTTINEDKLPVVLAGSEPKLHNHDRYYFNGIEVQVTESTIGKMAYYELPLEPEKPTGQEEEITLWRVQSPNTTESPSWVAQWCVQPVATE